MFKICDEVKVECNWKRYKRGDRTIKLLACKTNTTETLANILLDKLEMLKQRLEKEHRGVQDLWLFRVEWYFDTVTSESCIFEKSEFMKKIDQLANYIRTMLRS